MEYKDIYASDYGILPNEDCDCTDALNALLSQGKPGTVFHLDQGVYHFHASKGRKAVYPLSNSEPAASRTLSLILKERRDIILEGHGARFVCHGHLQPLTLDSCANISLRNFSIDWEKPLVSEGILLDKSPDTLDLYIDSRLFPCFVDDYCLFFDIGDNEKSELTYGGHTCYDHKTLTVLQDSADRLHIRSVEALGNDRFRFYLADLFLRNVPLSREDIVVLRHNRRIHAGIFAENCKDIDLNGIRMYSSGGIGMLFQFCENIRCTELQFSANNQAGRLISCTRDDGMQFSNCRGKIQIESCTFHGLQDSPIDIHGTSVCVQKILDEYTAECVYMTNHTRDFRYWAEAGQYVRIINRKNLCTVQEIEVESFQPVSKDCFRIRFRRPIHNLPNADIPNAYALENSSNTPSVFIRDNHFGSCRSRGVLVTTPCPVRIENNLFASAGAAVLIAGDASYWYESGGCRDVTIQHNTFTDDCALSAYENSNAVITICPSVQKPSPRHPYHDGIRIIENTFHSADIPVLFAFSAGHLYFESNSIFHSERKNSRQTEPSLFITRQCDNAVFWNNKVVGNFSINTGIQRNGSRIST